MADVNEVSKNIGHELDMIKRIAVNQMQRDVLDRRSRSALQQQLEAVIRCRTLLAQQSPGTGAENRNISAKTEESYPVNLDADLMLDIVSHELRTPLTSIIGLTRAVIQHSDHMTESELLEVQGQIEEDAARLRCILDNAAIVASAGNSLATGPIDLSLLVQQSARRYNDTSPPGALRVRLQRLLPLVRGSEVAIEQILASLLQHAQKYCPRGTPIRLAGAYTRGKVTIRVRTHGDTPAEDEVQELFGWNTASEAPNPPGSLGLAIAKRLAWLMDGYLSAMPAPGGGLVFALTLQTFSPVDCHAVQGTHERVR